MQVRLQELENARDKELFCPGYAQASQAERVNCWVMIVAAVSKLESNFDPAASFREPDGNYSLGLLMLSTGECPNASTVKALADPVANLVCGTNMMAKLIGRAGFIDGPLVRRGAAQYWSTLRAPYKRWDPSRKKNLNLGHKLKVIELTRGYRGKSGGAGKLFHDAMEIVDDRLFEDESSVREEDQNQDELVDRDPYDKYASPMNDDRDFFEPRD